ncbi:MAG: endonuclease/exonuclease/phosphatase family protein [Chloroflexi bacterium]|nr:endonuclease/exonuclease/phosphatase family protein [Chloroflexota bacterium]
MQRDLPVTSNRSGRGWLYHLFGMMALVYGIGVSIPLAVNLVIGEGWPVIALYNTFAHFAWLPAFGLLAVAVVWRRWSLAGLMLVPVVAFMVIFGVRYLRPASAAASLVLPQNDAITISVMTYNILSRGGSYADTLRIIEESDADVVAVQELGFAAADFLADGLRERYPFAALHPHEVGVNGQGLFSRFPILESQFWQAPGILGAQSAIVVVEVAGRSVEVALHNIHTRHPVSGGFGFDPQRRIVGVDAVLAHVAADTAEHRILLGDFNMPELSSDYARISAAWMDAFGLHGRGLGLTFRPRLSWFGGLAIPILRIDYIFVDGPIAVQSAHVVADTGGSDHRAVVSQLVLMTGDPPGTTGL